MFTYLIHLFTSVFPPTETRPYPLTEIQVYTRTHTQKIHVISFPSKFKWLVT